MQRRVRGADEPRGDGATGAPISVGSMHSTTSGRNRRTRHSATGADVSAKDRGATKRQIPPMRSRRTSGQRRYFTPPRVSRTVSAVAIRRRDLPSGIMGHCRHHRRPHGPMATRNLADLAGVAADAGDLRRIVHRIDQDFRHRAPDRRIALRIHTAAARAPTSRCRLASSIVRDTKRRCRGCPPPGRFAAASRAPQGARRSSACAACRPACSDRSRRGPAKPTTRATSSASSRMVRSSPEPTLIGLRRGIDLQQEDKRVGAIVDMEKFAARRAAAPDRQLPAGRVRLRLVGLADQRRQDMAGVEIEVVAGAVEIGRHRRDVVAADIACDRPGTSLMPAILAMA